MNVLGNTNDKVSIRDVLTIKKYRYKKIYMCSQLYVPDLIRKDSLIKSLLSCGRYDKVTSNKNCIYAARRLVTNFKEV